MTEIIPIPEISERMSRSFDRTSIEFLYFNSDWWITAKEVGIGLKYKTPRISVMKLFYRYQDEIEEYSTVVKLTTGHQVNDVRLFNEKGAYLLIMFSKQPKAKYFRKWIISVIKEIRDKGYYIDRDKDNIVINEIRYKVDHVISDLKQMLSLQKEQQQRIEALELDFKVLSPTKRSNRFSLILEALDYERSFTIKDLLEKLDLPRSTLLYYLEKLHKENLVDVDIQKNEKRGRPPKLFTKIKK